MISHWLRLGFAFSLLGTGLLAQTPLFAHRGNTDFAQAGYGLCRSGDLDGDGVDDLLVSEVAYDGAAGNASGRVLAISLGTGDVIYAVEGGSPNAFLGARLASVGDLDGDGVPEWMSGNPFDGPNGVRSGIVTIHDGATGSLVRTHLGAPDLNNDGYGDGLGWVVDGGRDVDGDGVPDYLIAAPGDNLDFAAFCNTVNDPGRVDVHSGATGLVIHSFVGLPLCQGAGYAGALYADLNGDGHTEILLGFPGNSQLFGRIEVRDGATGALLGARTGQNFGDFFGVQLARVGDVNGDGLADFAVRAERTSSGPGQLDDRATITIHGTLLGTPVATITAAVPGDGLGAAILDAGDLDGDGVPEVALSRSGGDAAFPGAGEVQIYDLGLGANPAGVVQSAAGLRPQAALGNYRSGMAILPDRDGDGLPEIAAGASYDGAGQLRGEVVIYGSRERHHWLSVNLIEASEGGEVEFEVKGPAGGTYAVLGSVTGTSPATPLASTSIPLVFDPWTTLTLDASTTPLTDGWGTLDGEGRATASFTLPGLPAFLGLEHFSVVGIADPATGQLIISEAQRVTVW